MSQANVIGINDLTKELFEQQLTERMKIDELKDFIASGDHEKVIGLLEERPAIVSKDTIVLQMKKLTTKLDATLLESSTKTCRQYTMDAITYAASAGEVGTSTLRAIYGYLLKQGMSQERVVAAFSMHGEGVIIPAVAIQGSDGKGRWVNPRLDPNTGNPVHYSGESALHFLLEIGVDVRTLNAHGESLMHVAAWNNAGTVIAPLHEAGVSVSMVGGRGMTPMGAALITNNISVASALFEAGADPTILGGNPDKQAHCEGLMMPEGHTFVKACLARQRLDRAAAKSGKRQ